MNVQASDRLVCCSLLAVFFFAPASRAQTGSEEAKGNNSGNYNIQQTVELGYRQDWINGNQDTYDTFVDLGAGARLLDYTLNMRSINHQGLLFDNLNFSNFGYGGDPDNVSRLRIEKNKWYDFSLVFRRHKNFWDYNLLANPLNPVPFSTATPPFRHVRGHQSRVPRYQFAAFTRSRAAHAGLRLDAVAAIPRALPARVFAQSWTKGLRLTSFHGTTDFLLAQNFRMTTNAYHMGVDFRVLPKTTISYDQFLE